MQHMTHQLLHLVVIIEQGSLSRAAQVLYVTQPALSRSIRFLEAEVNGKLLNRGRDGATPTKLGEQLYVHGKNILASLERAEADVQAWHQHDRGHLIVGSTALPSMYFVPEAIASFLAERPKVGLRFEVHHMRDLTTMLRQGSIDLFIGALAFEKQADGIETTLLLEDELSIICGADHPLAKSTDWETEDLQKYPWMLPTADTALRQQAEAVFAHFGLSKVEIVVETIAATAIVPLMRHGSYLTMHSKFLLGPEITSGNLVVLPQKVPSARRSLTAFHRKSDELTELVSTFIDHLKTLPGA
ncbi:LysR family transcriptional regulator [Alphaproteobacteria bacterium KMM 3653]|uniref:LysR family transcriptional regulator n=1 Tax=Harenicola maris TaxID=2841044 RepID=A0AAP2CMT0_9RHOB|nr:LysR family transcriptional regulator [Harenicola maris]